MEIVINLIFLMVRYNFDIRALYFVDLYWIAL